MEDDPTWKDQNDNVTEHGMYSQRYCPCDDRSAPAQSHRRPILAILRFSIQILLSILLIANLLMLALVPKSQEARAGNSNAEPNSAAVIFNLTSKVLHTQYGSDVSYMSLDPQFDWLWSTENNKYAGLIALDPPNKDGSIRWGAITM